MHQLESLYDNLWFCELEHLYAYKASQDVQYNSNYDLITRIQHYTEITKNAGSTYDMNQDHIFHLAQVLLEDTTLTIEQANEDHENDQYNN